MVSSVEPSLKNREWRSERPMKAVRIYEQGPPEVLRYEEVPKPSPKEDEVLVKLKAIGVNFTDVYTRSGVYPAKLPLTLGVEGAGVVSAVGGNVTAAAVGDSVAYTNVMGAYSEYAAVPASRLVKLPRGLDPKVAAAVLLQGMTAHYLVHDTFPLERGHKVLIHAGAGGVGQLLVQMAKQIGAYVIATTSTEEKARVARTAGADSAIVYTKQDFEEEVKRITGGRGVNVVYDSVGKVTFEKSLRCLLPRGYLVLYGQSSGIVPPVAPSALQKGSLFLTRPMLGDYTATHDELQRRAQDVFSLVLSGKLKFSVFRTLHLSQAVKAHRLLEGRKTTGKLLLIP
jgi:NADPH2:quinone reductase